MLPHVASIWHYFFKLPPFSPLKIVFLIKSYFKLLNTSFDGRWNEVGTDRYGDMQVGHRQISMNPTKIKNYYFVSCLFFVVKIMESRQLSKFHKLNTSKVNPHSTPCLSNKLSTWVWMSPLEGFALEI